MSQPSSKFREFLKLACANKAMQQQLVEALQEEADHAGEVAKDHACHALFNEDSKPAAYGALAVQGLFEDLVNYVKKI